MPASRSERLSRVGSRQGSTQRNEAATGRSTEQAESGAAERGNPRAGGGRRRSVWRVKFPKLRSATAAKSATEGDEALSWIETAEGETAGSGEKQRSVALRWRDVATGCSADGSVFNFSQTPTSKPTGDGEKAKLSVLRTISKMLEENQLIRQRLAALSQADRGCAE